LPIIPSSPTTSSPCTPNYKINATPSNDSLNSITTLIQVTVKNRPESPPNLPPSKEATPYSLSIHFSVRIKPYRNFEGRLHYRPIQALGRSERLFAQKYHLKIKRSVQRI
jgi:hypothetical protein